MPILNVTKADLLKTANADSAWYEFKIVKVHPLAKSAKGDSLNQVIDCEMMGEHHWTGKVIPVTINTKMLGKLAPMWKAVLGEDLNEGQVDTDRLMGGYFAGKVDPVLQGNVMYDNITNYAAKGAAKTAGNVPF